MGNNLPKVKKGIGSGLSGLEKKARQVVLGVGLVVGAGLTGATAVEVHASVPQAEGETLALTESAVLLAPPELSDSPGTIAYHYSHRSHYSHSSHQSHRSHYSHYSG